jgi:serine/threonine protein kinase/tetratricopeptide (TPR) repeat protein
MNADEPEPLDESFTAWLVACDEALAGGSSLPDAAGTDASPELQPRLRRGLACLKQLEERWPRHPPRAAAVAEPLTRLGRFEIRRELGRGGYGVVYLADDPQLGRAVALKVPRADVLADEELRARFHHEARAAAGLDHPNLVAVYEAGADGAFCYITSAYCPGPSLAQWLKEQAAPVPERDAAALVAALADGVQHAHSRGVLHRDLKPANVLLTSSKAQGPNSKEGSSLKDQGPGAGPWGLNLGPSLEFEPCDLVIPRITDFGLAKLLTADGGQTQSGAVVGTPAYMAPEQAEGKVKEVGTAADVYALGAILYELLTGRPPFQAETVLGMLEQVRTQEPAPPRRLRPHLSRDLETVCLKCLHKEPHRRYPSAHALAEDLRRFLADEPVLARPVGGLERLGRWCKRRPAAAALVLAAAGFLVTLAVVREQSRARLVEEQARTERQRQQAEANLQQALDAVNQYLAEVRADPQLKAHDLRELRRRLLQAAVPFFQQFVAQQPDEPRLQAQRGAAFERLATINLELGDHATALEHNTQALAVFADLVRQDPDATEYEAELAGCHYQRGRLFLDLGRWDEAEAALTQAQSRFARLAADHPEAPRHRQGLANSHTSLGVLGQYTRRLPQAEANYQAALRVQRQLARDYPDQPDHQAELGRCLHNQGQFYQLHLRGRLADAEKAHREARDVLQPLTQAHPTVAKYQELLALSHHRLAFLSQNQRRWDPAAASYRDALAVQEALVRRHPSVPEYRQALAHTYADMVGLYELTNRPREAEAACGKALAIRDQLAEQYPDVWVYRGYRARSRARMGDLVRAAGRPEEACSWYDRAIDELEAILRQEPQNGEMKRVLIPTCSGRAELLGQLGRHREALRDWDRAIALGPGLMLDWSRLQRALTRARLGEYAAATAEADDVLQGQKDPRQAVRYLRDAARVFAVAAAACPEPHQAEYAGRAVELLGRAHAAGYFHDPARREELR